jgi:hypothetical protein
VPPSPASVSQITQSPRFPGLRFHLLVADLDSGRVVMGTGYLRAAPEKNPGPPTRQSAVCGEDRFAPKATEFCALSECRFVP